MPATIPSERDGRGRAMQGHEEGTGMQAGRRGKYANAGARSLEGIITRRAVPEARRWGEKRGRRGHQCGARRAMN